MIFDNMYLYLFEMLYVMALNMLMVVLLSKRPEREEGLRKLQIWTAVFVLTMSIFTVLSILVGMELERMIQGSGGLCV